MFGDCVGICWVMLSQVCSHLHSFLQCVFTLGVELAPPLPSSVCFHTPSLLLSFVGGELICSHLTSLHWQVVRLTYSHLASTWGQACTMSCPPSLLSLLLGVCLHHGLPPHTQHTLHGDAHLQGYPHQIISTGGMPAPWAASPPSDDTLGLACSMGSPTQAIFTGGTPAPWVAPTSLPCRGMLAP